MNKILNNKLNAKYPNFENWKNSILSIENAINNKIDIIERENYTSKIIMYFKKLNKENKNKKDLLSLDEIKTLTSIFV